MNLQEIVGEFDRDGCVLIDSVLTASQIERAQAAVAWDMNRPQERYKWIRQRTYEHFKQHPIFVELIEHPFVLDFAAEWLGGDYHLIAAQCSRNLRDDHYAAGVKKLHQDSGLLPAEDRKVAGVPLYRYGFSAMWYVQDTPLEMGPTELVRGSHKSGVNYNECEPELELLFRQEIKAGSLLLFSHCTWHRGADNGTAAPRDLITNAYARPEIEKSHLLTPQEGGDRYMPPPELVDTASPEMQRLLAEPEIVAV